MKASKNHRASGVSERAARRRRSANSKPNGRDQRNQELQHCQEQLANLNEELAACRAELAAADLRAGALPLNTRSDKNFTPVQLQQGGLINLFVAAARLNANLDRPGVLGAIREILSDLIGVRAMALFEIDAAGKALSLLQAVGVDAEYNPEIPLGAGVIGTVATSGVAYFSDDGDSEVVACVPLKIGACVTGVMVLFRLLEQKPQLEPNDRDLLEFLSTHAALALYRSGANRAASQSGGACQ